MRGEDYISNYLVLVKLLEEDLQLYNLQQFVNICPDAHREARSLCFITAIVTLAKIFTLRAFFYVMNGH